MTSAPAIPATTDPAPAAPLPATMEQAITEPAAPRPAATALRVPPRFTPLQRALHWLMAAAILAMLFIGVGMVSTVSQRYLTLVSIHRPLGLAILLLALVRIAVRLRSGAPPLPADLPGPMRLAAHLSHYAFYALMLAMPLLGWGMLSAAAYPVRVLGLTLPPILPQSDALHSLLWTAHRTLAFAFFALILAHLGAALFHALIRRDGVFEAMAPLPDRSVARLAGQPGDLVLSRSASPAADPAATPEAPPAAPPAPPSAARAAAR